MNHKLLISLLLCSLPIFVCAQTLAWAKSMGGDYADYAYSMTTDDQGNVYTTGSFKLTVDFDPGTDVFEMTATGSDDMFVTKFNADGEFIWAIRMGGTSAVRGRSIAINNDGHIVITGDFFETVDFDPGPAEYNLTAIDGGEMHIVILDDAGNLVFAGGMGGTNFQYSSSLALDDAGNIFIAGYISGECDFDPGAGEMNIAVAESAIFCLKLNAAGEFQWVKHIEATETADLVCWDLALDNMGNIILSGGFIGTVDFDMGAGDFTLVSAGSFDIYVCKLDPEGNFMWAAGMGNGSADSATTVTTDSQGNIIAAGNFIHGVDFDPGPEVLFLTSASSSANDVFIWKLDPSGNLIWAKAIGGDNTEIANSIKTDLQGNIYTVGASKDECDYDPGDEEYMLTPNNPGTFDAFYSILNAQGEFVWAAMIGGSITDQLTDIHIDASGHIYSCGYFSSTVDMDPNEGVFELSGVGDILVHKMSAIGNNIQDLSDSNRLHVFPNPATNVIAVSGISKITRMDIMNTSGQIISSTREASVDISGLAVGVYIIRVESQGTVAQVCFTKQ